MPIKIKIGDTTQKQPKPVQASIPLKITKTLDGNLIIDDHQYLDIIVSPSEAKIITMPKPFVEKDVYDYQKDFMYSLFKGGVSEASSPTGGPRFGMVETSFPKEGDVNTLQAVLYQISSYVNKTAHDEDIAREYDENIEDRFTDPDAKDSTEYGAVPPYQDTPEGSSNQADPTYTFAGYGYYY